jgi:hypothetical protein
MIRLHSGKNTHVPKSAGPGYPDVPRIEHSFSSRKHPCVCGHSPVGSKAAPLRAGPRGTPRPRRPRTNAGGRRRSAVLATSSRFARTRRSDASRVAATQRIANGLDRLAWSRSTGSPAPYVPSSSLMASDERKRRFAPVTRFGDAICQHFLESGPSIVMGFAMNHHSPKRERYKLAPRCRRPARAAGVLPRCSRSAPRVRLAPRSRASRTRRASVAGKSQNRRSSP